MTHQPQAIHQKAASLKQLPPTITIAADFAPGGIYVACKQGLETVSGTFTKHKPIMVMIKIKCMGDKTIHYLQIR